MSFSDILGGESDMPLWQIMLIILAVLIAITVAIVVGRNLYKKAKIKKILEVASST